MADNILMTHLVAGYPSMEGSKEAALAMARGGAACLEVQFPFSDPTADGPLIQGACTKAIEGGFSTDKGFALISELKEQLDIPLFLMTYGNLVVAAGVDAFIGRALSAGVSGLIVPDLPFDYDEGLYEKGKRAGLTVVPVVIPGIDPARLESVLSMKPAYVYTAVRKGITGAKSAIDDSTLAFLDRLSLSGTRVLAGFGIREKRQVDLLAPHVYGSVVGSALVDIIGRCEEDGRTCAAEVRDFVAALL